MKLIETVTEVISDSLLDMSVDMVKKPQCSTMWGEVEIPASLMNLEE